MKPPLSCAATQLLRAIVAHTGSEPHEIYVRSFRSVDWQSLTFTGERHELSLRLVGANPAAAVARLRDGLADVEWRLRGQIVADIAVVAEIPLEDGSLEVTLEALTLTDQS